MKCIICGEEIPQDETETQLLSDSMPRICKDCADMIAEAKKNRR